MEGISYHSDLPLQHERRMERKNITERPKVELDLDYDLESLLFQELVFLPDWRKGRKEVLIEFLLEHLLVRNPNLLDHRPGQSKDIRQRRRLHFLLLQSYPTLLKRIQNKVTVHKLLQHLLKDNPELDKGGLLDVLYSKRYRKEVWSIVERTTAMTRHEPCDALASCEEISRELSLLADRQKRLRDYEEEYGLSWHDSICYPLAPDSIADMPHLQRELTVQLCKGIRPVLSGMWQGMRVDSNDMTDSEARDVVSLLSLGDKRTLVAGTGGGEGILLKQDTFRGKYVLVCCISAPVLYGSPGYQSLLNLCHELSLERGDVKMVMVARMNVLADTEEVFSHSFSGFPTSCLAVPYEDWQRRERIWKLLKCGAYGSHCVIYGTNGLLLKSFCVGDYMLPYGAEAFPFTKEVVGKVDGKRVQLRGDGLKNLLRPYEYSPDVVVYQTDGPDQPLSEVIKNKHVGLYVCCDGELIPLLHQLYEQCKSKHEEFEIVVLYLPLESMIDPDLFKKKIDRLLQKQKIRGWWHLRFNHSVSMRFWVLTMEHDYTFGFASFDIWDKLIIVGPDGKILDMYGGHVIKFHGIDAHPFTRAAIVEKRMKEVRDLRLESLLEGQFFRGDDRSGDISMDTLLSSKKEIIIIMGRPGEYKYAFEGLVSQYNKEEEFEVVFIEYPRKGNTPEVDPSKFVAMPWYIHRCGGTYAPLAMKLEQLVGVQSLVGFGEDGHICSVKPLQTLYKETRKETLREVCLQNTLFQDIYQLFNFHEYAA